MRLRLYNAKILPSPESKLIDGEVLIENGTIRSIGAGAPRFEEEALYLMKFVQPLVSGARGVMPRSRPASIHLSSHAILWPRLRIV